MYFGRVFSVEEITAEIDRVRASDLQRIANALFRTEAIAVTLLGNLGSLKIERADLVC